MEYCSMYCQAHIIYSADTRISLMHDLQNRLRAIVVNSSLHDNLLSLHAGMQVPF